ncbi:secreted protein [Actinoallomurus bryophytorum]|uniref:Secreted protein n=1 Tax=Actinoallomurus bryophytorum TaxID=1490222 RepID=A0A543CQD1_9ACTN|nr:sulfite oxidase [Actinoallomurus bryophytorum]TQL99305.1 secreted protein [Actinoallomurus bryophytorum]
MGVDLIDGSSYERDRAPRGAGGISRRSLLRYTAMAGAGAGLGLVGGMAGSASADDTSEPIVKPLPPELFTVFGSNAEMKWEAMQGQGYTTPIDRFFVRDHTRTPLIEAATWRLKLWGTGLRGAPTEAAPIEFDYDQLRRLPAETVTAFIECTGNGRSFYTSQQQQTVTGTAWGLGAVGVARWRGVPLRTVLELAGLSHHAVDVMPRGLDDEWTDAGVNHGHVRRPLPVTKASRDVLLAYEMNGEPLPPDHGFPVRLVVPNWIGIASIKWVGDIQVSDHQLSSPWDTQYYRLFGPGYPAEGSPPITRQVTKSAFELPRQAQLSAGRTHMLHGRSWSGNGRILRVEISTDGGTTWHQAHRQEQEGHRAWLRWTFPWRPAHQGPYELLARAVDETGHAQPDTARYNTLGYLFDAVVRHPVTVS